MTNCILLCIIILCIILVLYNIVLYITDFNFSTSFTVKGMYTLYCIAENVFSKIEHNTYIHNVAFFHYGAYANNNQWNYPLPFELNAWFMFVLYVY